MRAGGVDDRPVVAAAQLERHLPGDRARDPTLRALAQHQTLRIEPATLIEQPPDAPSIGPILLERVFVVDRRGEAFISDMQQRHARRLVDTAALGLDDAVLDLVAHAESMAATDAVGLHEEREIIREVLAVERNRPALFEAHPHGLARDGDLVAPERDTHDGLHDVDAAVQELEVLGLVRRTEQVRVGGVGLLDAHLVVEPRPTQILGHLAPATELCDERRIEPGLVDAQLWVGEQPVAVKALDVVALVGAAVTPDIDAVLAHRAYQHRPRDGAAERRGVEVGRAGGGDMEGPALQGGKTFRDQGRAAVDEPRDLGAERQRLRRDRGRVRLIRLTEIGGVGAGLRAVRAHPVDRGAGVEATGERDADAFADGQ